MSTMVFQPEFYHKEVAFCKVYDRKSKEIVEKLLLRNRISYFIELQKKSLIKRIFSPPNEKVKEIFIIKINEADVEKASILLKEFDKSVDKKIHQIKAQD